ncbi:hypothetical protein BDF22DRAFT_692986 [Syncephalis plumigaleata]|nr:hypothetical protein BDF22DRAFT_692986 [Syncephalis plumigaleata]
MTMLSNVFASTGPVAQAIETATTPRASQEEDWQLIIDTCNLVNSRPDGSKEAVKAVRKRLKSKHINTQLLTITLAQSLFDNCGAKFRVAISTPKFTETLAKIMSSPDTDPVVQSKLYIAITAWAEALRGEPGMDAIPTLYNNLNTVTSLDGNASTNNGGNTRGNTNSHSIENMSPEKVEQEVNRLGEVCRNSVQMLSESLVYTDPDTEDIRKNELIQEFYKKCQGLHAEIGRFLSSVQDEKLFDQLLGLNQELLDVFQQYNDIVERHDIVNATRQSTGNTGQSPSATIPSVSNNSNVANNNNGYATQPLVDPFSDQSHQPAGLSSTALGKQPENLSSNTAPSVEPYRVAPPSSNVSQNPFDDILAYSDAAAAEAQLSAPLTPMATMPAAPLLPKPAEQSPLGWHINGMSPTTSPTNTQSNGGVTALDAPIVTKDEHGNQHAII